MTNIKKMQVAFAAFLTTLISSVVPCVLYVAQNDWFGKGDIAAFVFWSFLYSVFIVIFGFAIYRETKTLKKSLQVLMFIFAGLFAGFLITLTVRILLSDWFYTFSFPVFYFWIFSGFSGMLSFYATTKIVADTSHVETTQPIINKPLGKLILKLVMYLFGIPIGLIISLAMIYFLLILGSVYIWNKGDNETYLIHSGYTGPIIIAYDFKDGEPEQYKNGRRLYKIPKSGVLKTRFDKNTGWSDMPKFFYIDEDNTRKSLFNASSNWNKAPNDSMAAVFGGSIGSYRNGGGNTEGPGTVWYEKYTIATQLQIDSMNYQWSKLEKEILSKLFEEKANETKH